ncbi:MAG TPA: hypothetical protein DCR97_00090 [Deltaproteobacteria bacterium]|nr:hypothetical protein [Deltaproteobacteria bacterium]
MRVHGAKIKEQGVTFAVVIVKSQVLNNRPEADKLIQSAQTFLFPGVPVVLMAQDSSGKPTYYGRSDLSKFLASVPLNAIPWKEYSLSER